MAGEFKQAYFNGLSHCTELMPAWYASRSRYFKVRSSFLPFVPAYPVTPIFIVFNYHSVNC